MPWNRNDFPDSMKSLNPVVRDKAIDIANTLLEEEGYEEDRAIPIAIAQAEEWAQNRGIPTKQRDNEDGDLHVVPYKDIWAIRAEKRKRPLQTCPTKSEAVQQGRKLAEERRVDLIIHKGNGEIQETRSYSGSTATD